MLENVMFYFLRSRIQNKLVLAFVFVLIIPTTLITTYTLKASTDSLLESAVQDELAEMRLKADAINKVLDSAKSSTLFISQSPTMAEYADALERGDTTNAINAVNQLFSSFLNNSSTLYKDLRILDRNGMEIIRVDNSAGKPVVVGKIELEDKASRPYYYETIRLNDGEVYISGFDLNVTLGKIDVPYVPVIRYATPIFSANGKLVGVLVVKAFAQQLLQVIEEDDGDAGAHKSYLVDKDGSYLFGVEPAKLYSGILKGNASLFQDAPRDAKVFQNNPDGFLIASSERPNDLQTYTHIHPENQPAIDWTLIHQRSTADIFGEIANARTIILLVALASLLLAIGMATVITRNIVRPISQLSVAMEAIGSGRYDVQLPSGKRKDEIGKLVTTFEKMNTDLNAASRKLQSRTRELEIANKIAVEANRLKSEFLSTMSHELRTPLNSIVGFTDIMLTGKPGPLNNTQQSFLERVSGNNRRLLKLINDILDLSRIEAGRMELFPVPYAPRDMLERVAAQTSALFSKKNLQFTVNIDPDLPSTVVGDKDRVEQVVVNLLSNAAKFTNAGSVTMTAAERNDGMWTIDIEDTGVGMAPHALEMIFEPFRQIDGTTSRQHGGSGLGLAIVRELCQMMNGQILVRSEVGKGSTFTIVLPVGKESEVMPESHAQVAIA
jgi:signal transduction histidine kinase